MTDSTDPIIQAESGGNPNATNPNSSASGLGQFINSTWVDTIRQHRPDIADGKSDQDLIALKSDPALSREMTGAYAADNQAFLKQKGLPVTPGTTYLAHFAGPDGAAKVLSADPSAPIESLLTPAAVAANPFLKGMTAQGLQAWAAKKMGVTSPTAGAPGTPTAVPAPPVAPQQQPIFANGPAAPQAPTAPAYHDPAAPPMQPLFAAQRKPIDISGLRAALAARAPIFANSQG
jgi:hypothetical protein